MWCDVSVEFAHNFLSFPSNEFTIFSTILLMPFNVVFYGHDYLSLFILYLLPTIRSFGYTRWENSTFFFISGARFFALAFNVLMKCNKKNAKGIIFSWRSRSRHIKGIFPFPRFFPRVETTGLSTFELVCKFQVVGCSGVGEWDVSSSRQHTARIAPETFFVY